ncbi:MAG TPA: LysM peptidoglycan-binding domain-containing protein [Candidatus Dormibacteraeota bacterium]|jgi:LysM repeat protein|nr:LysM peptidoglycan-binding domain-containing protein [Candidatus Dormibacteraeota bacterium]
MLGITRITVCGLLAGACAAVSTPALTAFAEAPAAQTITVVRGDTLGRIASRSHTTVARLVDLNKGRYPSLLRNRNLIHPGWVLVIGGAPAPSAPAAPTTPAPVAQPAPSTAPAPIAGTYTVVRGDSLSRIAYRNHTSVARLVDLNKGRYPSLVKKPGLIHVGWVLTLR